MIGRRGPILRAVLSVSGELAYATPSSVHPAYRDGGKEKKRKESTDADREY
jgi:hypothetical protein